MQLLRLLFFVLACLFHGDMKWAKNWTTWSSYTTEWWEENGTTGLG